MLSWMGVNFVELAIAPAAGKNKWTEVFKPEGYVGNSVDGFFLIDSFFYIKKDDGKNSRYLPRLLAEIHRDTGLFFFFLPRVVEVLRFFMRRMVRLISSSFSKKFRGVCVF